MKPAIVFILTLLTVLLLACSSSSKSTPSPAAAPSASIPTLPPDTGAGPADSTTAAPATDQSTPQSQKVSGVATDVLNVRAGPGLNYAVKTQLKQGDSITIIGKSADGLWWQFSGGWVSATYIQVSGDSTTVPVSTPAPGSVN